MVFEGSPRGIRLRNQGPLRAGHGLVEHLTVKSFIFTMFYNGFGIIVTFSHNGNARPLGGARRNTMISLGFGGPQGLPVGMSGMHPYAGYWMGQVILRRVI